MPDQADNIGEVFVSVGADLTKLRTDMVQARTEAVAGAKKISDAISKSVSARYPGELSGFGTGPLRNPIFTQRGAELDRMMYGDARRSASSTPTTAERDLYQQGDRERGMAVERQMREEQKQGHRQAALEAKEAARVARLAWKEAQRAAVEHAEELRRRWAATRAYLLGDLAKIKVFGNSLWSDLSGGASKAFSIIGGAAKVFFAPWTVVLSTVKALVPLMLLGVGAATAFGGASLKAAASWEELTTRVRHMVGSEQGMQALVKQADYIQARTRFANTDALNALALMKSAGVEGRQAAAGIANMASVTQSTMSSAAQQIMSGRAFMLRRYGIEQARDKGEMIVRFKMPTGREVVLTAKSFSENIKNILQAVNMKFAGAAVAAAKTMAGIFSTIRNLFMDGVRQFGMGLLPFGKAVGTLIINRMNELIASGKLKEWGENVGKWLLTAVAHIGAFIKTMPIILEELKKIYESTSFSEVLFDALTAGGVLIAALFVAAIESTWNFWKAVGELIASIFRTYFVNTVADMGILGSGAAEKTRAGLVGAGASKLVKEFQATPGLYETVSQEDAWKAFQQKYPALKGLDWEQLSMRQDGSSGFRLGSKENKQFFEGELGSFLQSLATGGGIGDALKGFVDLPAKIEGMVTDAVLKFKSDSMKALVEGGVDTGRIGTAFKGSVEEFQKFFEQFFKVNTGGPTGREDGKKKTEAVGAEVRSTSFADWVKVAQEAALKKKDSDHLAGIDAGVKTLVGQGGLGGFQWTT